MKTLFFDAKNYPEHGSVFHRTAIRGVIFRGKKLLLVTNKFGDYKFPGGGAEPGESHEETLARELKEETGYSMKPETCREWLLAKERRKGITADILEMDSHYYFCEIEEQPPSCSSWTITRRKKNFKRYGFPFRKHWRKTGKLPQKTKTRGCCGKSG